MSVCYLILAGTLLFTRLSSELYGYVEKSGEENSIIAYLLSESYDVLTAVSVVAAVATVILPLILLAVRFWKNLIRDGGYLSFTLPVKASHHVGCRIVTALLWTVISAVVSAILVAAALLILNDTALDAVSDIWNGMVNSGASEKNAALILWGLAAATGLLAALKAAVQIAFSMSIGQLARKNKLLAAVGCWFGVVMLMTVVSTMGNVVALSPAYRMWVSEEPVWDVVSAVLPLFAVNTVISTAFIAIGWCVANYIFKNKLNLE